MDRDNMSETIPDARAMLFGFEPDRRGRIIGHCPELAGEAGDLCLKFENPDPDSRYDFWLMMHHISGKFSLLSMLIPLEDGGLQHFVQVGESRSEFQSTFIQRMKQSHGSFGVVSISKLEVKTYYNALQSTFVGTRFRVGNYDASMKLLKRYQEFSSYEFPPLPKTVGAGTRSARSGSSGLSVHDAIRCVDPENYDDGRAIYFPTFEEQDQGREFIVDDGDEIRISEAGFRSIGADLSATRPPGIHVEFAHHSGDPSHVTSLFWYQPADPNDVVRFLFGDWCKEVTYHDFIEQIFVQRKRSWFRKRKKITIIRKDLIVVDKQCHSIKEEEDEKKNLGGEQ